MLEGTMRTGNAPARHSWLGRRTNCAGTAAERPSAPTTSNHTMAIPSCFGMRTTGNHCAFGAIHGREIVGRRGPLPKPTKAKKFEGNPGKRKLPESEPEPRIDDLCPPPPSHLPELAQDAWKAFAKELHSIGLLTSVDYHALEQYCTAYAFWRHNLTALQAHMKESSSMVDRVTDEKGNLRYSAPVPESSLMLKFGAELNRWSKVLGLGPAYRVALTTGHGDEPIDDPLGKQLESG